MVSSFHSAKSMNNPVLNPAEGAVQYGYREISGYLSSTGDRLFLSCWASVYDDAETTETLYETMMETLGLVDGHALPVVRLPGHTADRFGSMSERVDVLGRRVTVWVTSRTGSDAHGAVLAAVNGDLLQTLILDAYVAKGSMGATHVVERIDSSTASRQSTLELEPWADTMARLPLLSDLDGILVESAIGLNLYTAHP